MNDTFFYIFGIALVVSAVGVAAIGLRFENFPANRGILAGTILYFTVLVGLTAVFAVLNAQDEQAAREAEQAAETSETTAGATATSTTASGGGGGSTLNLAASPSELAFDTTSLQAKAGNLAIDFTNPNPDLAHDVCVDSPSGSELGCSDLVTGSSTTLSLQNLKPGKYTFFCSVPGHEDGGMKGTLTVQ